MIAGEVISGKYRIVKKIGQGGFASVYLAFDLKLEREVAIKVLSSVEDNNLFRERFYRESQALAKLNHPNIITVFDCGEHNGHEFLVMELVNGPSLETLISKMTLKMPQVCSIALQICEAMRYAHDQGFLHRDLTLKNIMLDEEETENARVKILDFGLVKLLYSDIKTTGNAMMGTPAFMAPEQVVGKPVDNRIDIWAFGVGLYRIITGEFPFKGEHPAALMYSIVNDAELEIPATVPRGLKKLISDCLAKDPEKRPLDFGEIASALEEIDAELRDGESRPGTELVTNVGSLAERNSKRNPYLNRVMIKSPNDFFGREKEIRKIYSRLDAPQPQSISVVGDRRIGKSSLLNHIHNRKNRKKFMQNYDSSIFVYLDFQNTVDNDVSKFIDLLFNVFSFETGDQTRYTARPKTLDQLKDVIEELHEEGKRIIIMMDEFELITRNENFEQDFFSFLRSLANTYRVAYVTSSREELQLMCHDKDISDSPFFNIFSNLPLRPFSREDADKLISIPSRREGVPLEEYSERLLDMAGLFPFYLQIACSSLFEFIVDNPSADPDWKEVLRVFTEEAQPHYNFIWERFDDPERGNLARIVQGKMIDKKFNYVTENLLRRGYLVEDGGGLRLCSSTFADFAAGRSGGQSGQGLRFSSILSRLRKKNPG
ncbi:MAG: protein kinase [Candidatus Krumholzibacteriota bacterium]|nr:protein kinase [Candidatus Krumholzibacteriota bacterium]